MELRNTHIVLASQSPRRRELLGRLGLAFDILPAQGEEQMIGETPDEIVEELSRQKAEEVLGRVEDAAREILVIGADTVVAVDGEILGKPRDREDARRMIRELQDRVHQVYTGVTLLRRHPDGTLQRRTFHEETHVDVYAMSDEEIEAYIDTPEPYDKAGAYGIQGGFGLYIRKIDGDYNNVVGLPAARVYHEIRKMMDN
ncbi:MAG: septum formation protein Maf [Lachnospiraceae bacterium]|nr:septum formation protein Maf [Lachnospiraceae bacterium]